MLSDLHVRDLGVIHDVTLSLAPGMTALTGETGAGKTLLVQALQLVLGGRTTPGLVRAGAPEAAVEARFLAAAGEDRDPGEDGEETVLARSVPANGRSRAWVDGRMVPVAALEEAAAGLLDIHGQHDQQSLLSVAGQRAALDAFAGSDQGPLVAARRELSALDRRIADLGGDERERARQMDLLRYQIAEIGAASIDDPDEDVRLAAEEERLADAARLREAAARAADMLDGEDDGTGVLSATALVGSAAQTLAGRAPFGASERRLRGAFAELADAASELRHAAETWEDDPSRLEVVQERRRLLGELRRKYGDTLGDVLSFDGDARSRLRELEGQSDESKALVERRLEAARAVAAEEQALRDVRAGAAPLLGEAVTGRLRALAMRDANFEVTVGDEGAGDAVQFLLAANRGEPAQPLGRVASGGELSRTMLALRLVVDGGAPTMLFDEVDAGVGGAAAVALAAALREVAVRRQVLVVTHLPQVAAAADRQIAVHKSVGDGGRTITDVEHLDGESRVVELSRMLSGHPDSPTARAHAEELLGSRGRGEERARQGDEAPKGAGAGPRAAGAGARRRVPASTTRRAARD